MCSSKTEIQWVTRTIYRLSNSCTQTLHTDNKRLLKLMARLSGHPHKQNPHMGQMFLPWGVPPTLPACWQLSCSPSRPLGHLAALLASSGLGCSWATMDVSQPAKVSDIWSSICDVTNSWPVIRPLWEGGSKEMNEEKALFSTDP